MSRRRLDSTVRKRCRHTRSEWDLCGCPWYYHVTHGTYTTKAGKVQARKHRGKIPGAATFDDARKAYALLAARIRNGQPPFEAAPATGLTVAQLAEEWLSLPRGRKASVVDGYRDHLRAHILPALGTHFVTAVTPETCEAFVLALKRSKGEKPLSIKTKKSIAMTLQVLFTFAQKKRLRANNPAQGLPATLNDPDAKPDDSVIDPKDHTKFFSADEAQDLLATCRDKFPEWYPFVLTGLQTGMRLGELRALRYDRINWRGGYVTVDRAWVKGRLTSPKNGKSRTVSMSRDLRAVLYLRWRRHRTSELIFPSRAATPLETSRLQRFWSDLLEAAELGYRTRHAMRHTHDSLMIQAGVPPAKVAAESGRTLQETMRTYAHFLPGGNREDAEVLAGLLSPQPHVSFKGVLRGFHRQRTAPNLRVAGRKA